MAYEYKDEIKNALIESFVHVEGAAFDELYEVYRKARAFDHIKVIHDKNVDEMSISDTECIEMIGNELERG
jgi:hypothetical protein